MADWRKKARRVLSNELRPGEDVVAAIFLQPDSSTASSAPGVDVGLAAELPDAATVIALTTQRILAMGHRSLTGRPREIVSTLAPNDLVRIEVEQRSASSFVVMKFTDGTERAYEAPLNNDIRDFAERINRR